jgi:hypothetical protein
MQVKHLKNEIGRIENKEILGDRMALLLHKYFLYL